MTNEVLFKETWRDIPGYEGIYIINNKGAIRTLCRKFKDKWNRDYVVKETGIKYQNIYESIKKNKKAGGYMWKYA